MMIYCPQCGTANRQGSRFCNLCGFPVGDTPEEAEPDAERVEAATDAQAEDEVGEAGADPKLASWSELSVHDVPGQESDMGQSGIRQADAAEASDAAGTEDDSQAPVDGEQGDREAMPSWMRSLAATESDTEEKEPGAAEMAEQEPAEQTDMPVWLRQLVANDRTPEEDSPAVEPAGAPETHPEEEMPAGVGADPGVHSDAQVAENPAELESMPFEASAEPGAPNKANSHLEEHIPPARVTELLADTQLPVRESGDEEEFDDGDGLVERGTAVRRSPVQPSTAAGSALAGLFAAMPTALPSPSGVSAGKWADSAAEPAGAGDVSAKTRTGTRSRVPILLAVIVVAVVALIAAAIMTGRIPLQ